MSRARKTNPAAADDVTPAEELKLPLTWEARDYQKPLWKYLLAKGGPPKRADVVAHRRWGKDEVALHWAAAAASQKQGLYWHMLPELAQGRKAIWDAVNPHTGRKRIDEAFPRRVRKARHMTDMKIELINGSVWQVVGSDNYDRLVGSSPAGVVFSEWSLAKPEAWEFIRPILAENGGWAVFLWTPRGRNHATRAFEARERDRDGWYTLRASVGQSRVFTDAQLAREKAELIAECGSEEEGEARYASEYLVAFDAAVPGSYYGSLLKKAADEGRLGCVPWDPALRVETAWDLGVADYTAIWFFQQAGQEIRVIDYYETSGEGLDAIVREAIAAKPYVYGTHHLPHDVMSRELIGGRSRYDALMGLGLRSISVGTQNDPQERIHAVRLTLPMMWFDAERCALGLERLRAYAKKWNQATSSYSGPLHDRASHGADAFGEFCLHRRAVSAPKPAVQRFFEPGLSWMA